MNIALSDVTVHIDQLMTDAEKEHLERGLRALDGVVSVHNSTDRPHLMIVQYNPDKVGSDRILKQVTSQGVHAELIGI